MKICIALLMAGLALAQPPTGPDMPIDAKTRDAVIGRALDRLEKTYVYPEAADKMAESIRARQNKGEYAAVNSSMEFARRLTDDLRSVSHDLHLRVYYTHNGGLPAPRSEEIAQRHYGFEKVEHLPGNIGYLDLRAFNPVTVAGETASTAMNSLADCGAIIIDLRQNGGGEPGMVQLIASYLFSDRPVHLNDLYWRPSNRTQEWWTLRQVNGRRMPDADVYILTSHRTFSAAEEFTYDLKNLKRATIVGEVTGGGAHPGGVEPIGDHFLMFVPSGRAINPVTKTDWEGTGVKPDVEVPAEKALVTAQVMALRKAAGKASDAKSRERLEGLIADLEKPGR